MTLRQLSYLLAVAEAGSFTAAARELHVSQPSLSQQIRALEAELGGALLERPPGPVRLTAAGRALASEARRALAATHRGEESARRAMGREIAEFHLATVRSLAVSRLPAAIEHWRQERPGMTVRLQEHAHRKLVEESVREGRSRVGIAPRPASWEGAITTLSWDQLVAVLPRSDALTAAPRVRLGELASREWVLFEEDHGLRDIGDWACRHAGYEPHGVAYTAQVEAAARLAAAGVGVALAPDSAVPADLRDVARPLDPPIHWEITAYALTPGWSPETTELLEALRGPEPPAGAVLVDLGEASLGAAGPGVSPPARLP
jgi:DNA-binding transcriptional LysR family regulator